MGDAKEKAVNPKFMLMRYVLPKEKKQDFDVHAFDWLNLRHIEKCDKRTLKNSSQWFRTFGASIKDVDLSSYVFQKKT